MPPDSLRADLRRYVESLAVHAGADLVSVVLFGSRARGEARPESDIDLLVVVRGLPRSRFERYRPFRDLARQVSDELAAALSLILATPEEAARVKPYYLGMLSGHEILVDRDGFFAGVLDRLRRRLAQLGSRRYVDPDGYEYWDLKPDWKPGDVVEL
ncbi:MAG TPA: nucleotidyltransferase domain-containing protein [Candidatus Tectomicrobia bacterium]|nr:nucleotidyltransferase domain-containing protein [Candidatus Tectomicrobia bacterium]